MKIPRSMSNLPDYHGDHFLFFAFICAFRSKLLSWGCFTIWVTVLSVKYQIGIKASRHLIDFISPFFGSFPPGFERRRGTIMMMTWLWMQLFFFGSCHPLWEVVSSPWSAELFTPWNCQCFSPIEIFWSQFSSGEKQVLFNYTLYCIFFLVYSGHKLHVMSCIFLKRVCPLFWGMVRSWEAPLQFISQWQKNMVFLRFGFPCWLHFFQSFFLQPI